ncbi:hypothetical protein D0894_08335 [Pseudomonas monteilii]|uniref:Uncharacterized protein n=1 Tax=Pseudomonas monteilii TaxID=76759 RepID=A0A399M9T7_9PSED|nr:hypothetical protein D0894_08335 [Pseudomonas monteilii]
MLEAAQQQGPPMPRPSHLIISAPASAAFYICTGQRQQRARPAGHRRHSHLITLTLRPGQWAIASSVGHGSIDKVLTQSGARSAGSC